MSADNETPVTNALKGRLEAAIAAYDADPNDADNVANAVRELAAVGSESLDAIGGLLNRAEIFMAVGGALVAGCRAIVAAYEALVPPTPPGGGEPGDGGEDPPPGG